MIYAAETASRRQKSAKRYSYLISVAQYACHLYQQKLSPTSLHILEPERTQRWEQHLETASAFLQAGYSNSNSCHEHLLILSSFNSEYFTGWEIDSMYSRHEIVHFVKKTFKNIICKEFHICLVAVIKIK